MTPAERSRVMHAEEGTTKFRQAIHFATWVHAGQARKYNGLPYVTHPIRCGSRALSLTGNYDVAIAMLLHDGPEDQAARCPFGLIEALYGQRVASIVMNLTNPSKAFKDANRAERKAIDRKHYQHAEAIVKACKCIDRIDNLGEMDLKVDPGFARVYCDESELLINVMRMNERSPFLDVMLEELANTIDGVRNKLGVIS